MVESMGVLGEDTIRQLRLNSPAGGWLPALRDLTWTITASNLPCLDLFLSPHLETILFSISLRWNGSGIPLDILPAIASIISTIPVPALRTLHLAVSSRNTPWEYFKDSFSSVVLRCGPSLVELTSPIPLSDAAVNHLIQLPHLRTWLARGPPPSYSTLSLPLAFPPLTHFTLGEGAARGWLSLFQRLEDHASATRNVTQLSRMKESLVSLRVERRIGPVIDTSFASLIQMFRNLSHLNINVSCHSEDIGGRCLFKLTNDGVATLAMALPQLRHLCLGIPCSKNTCATTVACLLPISVYCLQLNVLEIHFNTTNIVGDFKTILVGPRFRELRSLPRGTVWHLGVHEMPLTLDEPDIEVVVVGMVRIFPSLGRCAGFGDTWDKVNKQVEALSWA